MRTVAGTQITYFVLFSVYFKYGIVALPVYLVPRRVPPRANSLWEGGGPGEGRREDERGREDEGGKEGGREDEGGKEGGRMREGGKEGGREGG